MYSRSEKTREVQSRAAATKVGQKNGNVEFEDRRNLSVGPIKQKSNQGVGNKQGTPGDTVQRLLTEIADIEAVKAYFSEMLSKFEVEPNPYLTKFYDFTIQKNDDVFSAKVDLFDEVFIWSLNSLSLKLEDPALFETAAEVRLKEFKAFALEKDIPVAIISQLYEKARSDVKADVVTGFDLAGDRKPTVRNAIKHVTENTLDRAFYVEVDIKNLGGLNNVLGHTGADSVYGGMARIAEESMLSLETDAGVKLGRFRHGGDEFSFVVVGRRATRNMVEMAMSIAQVNIDKYIVGSYCQIWCLSH